MATDIHAIDALSTTIAETDRVHHLTDTNDSTIIQTSARDRQFLEQLAARNQLDIERIDEKRVQVTSTGYAGLISLPDGKPIHIEPKVTGTALLRLLQYSGAATVETVEQEASIEAGTDYVDLLGTLFADELEQVRRQGISQNYRSISQSEDYIRGRLDIQKQLQRKGPASPEFECSYDELTRDILLNQTILFASQTLLGAVSETLLKRRLRRHVQELRRSVTLRPVTYEEADSIHVTRLDNHYTDLLGLSKLVLQNIFIQDVAPGEAAGYTILLLMHRQFEQAVENATESAASEYVVNSSVDAKLEGFLEGDFGIEPKPDVLIENERGEEVLVLDAKWKEIDRPYGQLSPNHGDLYQMLSYQHHTETPGVLVYPGETSEVLGKARTKSGRHLWIATLPVSIDEESFGSYDDYRRQLDTSLSNVIKKAISVG